MGHFEQPPQARARIVGADGNDLMRDWMPPGFVQPANMPTSIVNLSPNAEGSEHIHQMAEREVEQMMEKRGKKWHRCPICSTPFDTRGNMQRCASQPLVSIVRNHLESNGWVDDASVEFVADNMASDRRRRKRIGVTGIMSEWRFVRTPRGHEEMPLVLWHPYPQMFPDGTPPHGELWRSILVCVGQENQAGQMTALPWFTRKPGDRRGSL